ncbi:MFS transporter [Alicyclobacillaceae bacterium I2511]|nr:MFS transporter [Alicyclobacillaceae bacterium I2511]
MGIWNSRKIGLAVGMISGTEWLVIATAFLGRFMLQFYQTTIGYAAALFGMDATQIGIAFALFGVAFGLAAFLVHKIAPAQLRRTVGICLLLLGATMPLYLILHGTIEVDSIMTFDGLVTGVYMDALMTMGGMASTDPHQRQIDQSAFAFWVSTALIIAPFATGALLALLGIKNMFALFASMAIIALPFLAALHGKHALQYVGHHSEVRDGKAKSGFEFLFRNKNTTFNASLIAALGNKIPYFIVLSFGVLYGRKLGLSAPQVFYLIGVMFVFNVGARLVVMLQSPIRNKVRYLVIAMGFAVAAAILLPLATFIHSLFYFVFPFAGIPEGMLWPIGLQIANTTFKAHEVGSSTSFFSSAMMITAALMPLVGWFGIRMGYSATFALFGLIVVVLFGLLLRYIHANGLHFDGNAAATGDSRNA